ncbi:putative (Di)nucleoside polyphosphate hydrolase [Corynebacterium glutamicum MB001]|uniref:NTP pyrophosphohydrolases including oxidative damage repair enzymes n=2 Tax=Corynebacterium TaxID=1716 RepID=Q8NL63_CORGL|nr:MULTISPECIES: NUDIX hydrolase [Corynebacterium]AGT06783.1 putative (Di)nucleoside polyphosphate hydrolase [Corynebacterium glutamicum MB001]AKF28872.1 NUDIX hydrolase [[Brevibacterium] flavum]ANE09725.1 NUDIX hydrolase [Corynebacterium glutamicum]AST22105.1 NUDIX hydrolase [Corynebacterium glutamicum ATCC 14067]ASW15381.1 putative (Di)nucleoside polyphosphate hydrolase [Corynebacterium glutamicum]
MSDLKPEGTTSGAPKRRRRRRSRRPSGQNQNPNQNRQGQQGQQTQNQPQAQPQSQQAQPQKQNQQGQNQGQASEKTSQRPKRRRSRRNPKSNNTQQHSQNSQNNQNSQNSQQNTQTQTSQSNKQKSQDNRRGKGRRSPTRRRSNTRVNQAWQQSRLVTSDETSAGGLVVSGLAEAVNANNEVDLSKIYVALIGRLDRRGRLLWSMPKGHVEPGEDKAATAEREVWEETGIHGEVFTELGVIDYWFVSEGKRIHKTVHHHLLRYVDGDLNDEDPEVTEVAWIPANQLIEHLAFADERKLARQAHDLLPEFALKEKAEGRSTPR